MLALRVFFDQPRSLGQQLSARVERCEFTDNRSSRVAGEARVSRDAWCTLAVANGDRAVIYMPAAAAAGSNVTVSVQLRPLSRQMHYQVVSEEIPQ